MTSNTSPPTNRPTLAQRLAESRVVIMDGATGTELERRGAPVALPLWSAHALVTAPDLVRSIHAEYVRAGAELLVANTFRTHRRSLAHGGLPERAAALTQLAVSLARDAARAAEAVWVLGSAAPLEDCYRPDLAPTTPVLVREHREHAEHLAAAGVDAILIETMNNVAESVAALRAARDVALPALVSFVCWDGARLLSGEPLSAAIAAALPYAPAAVLVNCLPPSNVDACLPALRASGLRFGVYPNLGTPDEPMGQLRSEACSPAEFAEIVSGWRGAGIVGGCCGTRPDHIRSLAQSLRS